MSIHRPLDNMEDHHVQQAQNEQERAGRVTANGSGAVWIGDLTSGSRKQSLIEAVLTVPQDSLYGETNLLRFELLYQCTSTHREVRVPGTVTVNIGNNGSRVPRVLVADEMQQLEPRQQEFRRLIQAGSQSEALEVQRDIMRHLERLEDSDEQ